MSNKKGEIVSTLAVGGMLVTIVFSLVSSFFFKEKKNLKTNAQIATPKCTLSNPQNQSCSPEGSWCITCTGNRGPCNTDAGVGLPYQCQSGRWNLVNNLGECNVTCVVNDSNQGRSQSNQSINQSVNQSNSQTGGLTSAQFNSITSLSNSCFSLRADFEVKDREEGKKSFYSWLIFESPKGGDVKLEYNGIHVAGWNRFSGGTYVYSPQWTQPFTHSQEAGIGSLDRGAEISFVYRGFHSGCNPQDIILSCRVGYRADGSTYVVGDGCSCRNCQRGDRSISPVPGLDLAVNGCTGGCQKNTAICSGLPQCSVGVTPAVVHNCADNTFSCPSSYQSCYKDGAIWCYENSAEQTVTTTQNRYTQEFGKASKPCRQLSRSDNIFSGECDENLVCDPKKGICVTPVRLAEQTVTTTQTRYTQEFGKASKPCRQLSRIDNIFSGECDENLVCDPKKGICVTPSPTPIPKCNLTNNDYCIEPKAKSELNCGTNQEFPCCQSPDGGWVGLVNTGTYPEQCNFRDVNDNDIPALIGNRLIRRENGEKPMRYYCKYSIKTNNSEIKCNYENYIGQWNPICKSYCELLPNYKLTLKIDPSFFDKEYFSVLNNSTYETNSYLQLSVINFRDSVCKFYFHDKTKKAIQNELNSWICSTNVATNELISFFTINSERTVRVDIHIVLTKSGVPYVYDLPINSNLNGQDLIILIQ